MDSSSHRITHNQYTELDGYHSLSCGLELRNTNTYMVDFSIFPRENMDWGNKMYSGTLQNVVQNLCAVPCRKCIVITIVLQNASVKIEVEEFENGG